MPYLTEERAQDRLTVRQASEADLPAMCEIYNSYVKDSTATFDTDEQTHEKRRKWYDEHRQSGLPVIVAEWQGEVIGWASLSFYHSRCAYRQTVEPSLYVAAPHHRRGVGRRLTEALMSVAKERGYHCVVALICSENLASLKLILDFGFTEVGTLREVGRKFDRWLDVTIVQRLL